MIIDSFRGDFYWLSNFSFYSFLDKNGKHWKTTEHYFQASKTLDIKERLQIQASTTPAKAKKLGRSVSLRKDWDHIKVDVMRDALKLKFDQNEDIKQKLLSTVNYDLVEGNNWGDDFWGMVNNRGLNILGKLLMELRDYYSREEN